MTTFDDLWKKNGEISNDPRELARFYFEAGKASADTRSLCQLGDEREGYCGV